jgi:hypothetical protein
MPTQIPLTLPFPTDLPPRPQPIHTASPLNFRHFINPRPSISVRPNDVEMGPIPPRRHQRPFTPHDYSRARPEACWRVLCSVKIFFAVVLVVGFWLLVILGATGKLRVVG